MPERISPVRERRGLRAMVHPFVRKWAAVADMDSPNLALEYFVRDSNGNEIKNQAAFDEMWRILKQQLDDLPDDVVKGIFDRSFVAIETKIHQVVSED